jgi:hypothetical protein
MKRIEIQIGPPPTRRSLQEQKNNFSSPISNCGNEKIDQSEKTGCPAASSCVQNGPSASVTSADVNNPATLPQRAPAPQRISESDSISETRTGSKKSSELKSQSQAPSDASLIALPVFDTQDQCTAVTGIPKSVLKSAKKKGCKAFKHSRVDLASLLRFLFSEQNGQPAGAWKDLLDEAKAKREMIRLARDERNVIDRTDVQSALSSGMALVFGEMDQAFTLNLPSQLKGLTEPDILSKLVTLSEQLKQKLKAKIEEKCNQTNQPPTESQK